MNELHQLYDNIVEHCLATVDEIKLVISINGYNEESLNSIIYARTGYHDWNQYQECELSDKEWHAVLDTIFPKQKRSK